MSNAIRLLLIDHHTLLRRCLVSMLKRRRCFHVVGDLESGCGALELVRVQQPDVVVIDPETPHCDAELIEQLHENVPCATVIVLSSGYNDAVKQVLLAGARGYIEKSCGPEDLVRAIKLAHAGEMAMAPEMVNVILQSLTDQPPADPLCALTKRELQVLELVVAGCTNPEIASKLFITEHTAKGHLANILGKLGLSNRVQLATYAIQNGLVSSSEVAIPAVH